MVSLLSTENLTGFCESKRFSSHELVKVLTSLAYTFLFF
jgi:hypothetical protein